MTEFFALLRLQLLSRFADLKPRNMRAKMKDRMWKSIGITLLIVLLIAYLGGMLFFLETKILDILIQMGMADTLIILAVTLTTAGTLILAFFFTMSTLYLGRDSAHLASMPLKTRTVLSAKLVQVWISETCIDAFLLLPACILFGVRTGAEPGFYLRMIVVWLLAASLPICIISFVSSLLIRISGLWKHREMLLTVSGIALMVAYMFLMMNLGGMSGDSASDGEMLQKLVLDNSARFKAMAQMFPPAAWAAEGMLGRNTGMFLLWIGISLAAPVLTVWLLGFGYRKLSLLQSETPVTSKKRTGKESFASGSAFKACCLREIRTILRVPSYATNILPISFMPVLMILMMYFMIGRNADAGETLGTMLGSLPQAPVMGILAAVMAYMAGMNPALATAVSREGKGHQVMISLPVSPRMIIRSKFAVGFTLSLLGVLAATILLIVFFPEQLLPILLAFVLCVLYCDIASILALCRDIRKPKLDWVTEQEAVKQNYGLLLSMLISWGILGLLAVLTFFLIRWGLELVPVFLILAAVLTAMCLLAHYRLHKVTDRYYCAG